ncbi:MAG: nucleotidyltransferase family protein [Clostridia bacterium]|nr:nucleotidyltransferase family protein [Clostridia bacterium]
MTAVDTTRRAVLALLGTALFGKELKLPEMVDWQAVLREMQLHAVHGLAADLIVTLEGVDAEVRSQWVKRTGQSVQRFYHVLHEQQEAVALLEQAGFRPAVLKGASAAQYYPEPAYRAMGDSDLLLPGDAADRAAELLAAHGYQRIPAKQAAPRHVALTKNGVKFELHRSFCTMADGQLADAFDQLLIGGLKALRRQELCGYAFPALPQMLEGLVLLEHANHHMLSGIGLRQMLDWLVFVDRAVDDESWSAVFRPKLQEFGLERYAMVIARMGQLYFGLRTQGRTWCAGADEDSCAQLLAFVMDCGNFGVKYGRRRAASNVMTDFGGVRETFRSLQARGCANFAGVIARYPFLQPFAWLMRLVRLAALGLRRGLGMSDLRGAFAQSRRRRRLFRMTGVVRTRENEE